MTEEIHYKSAASRWFDKIPDDWHMSKLRFLVNIFTGNSLNDGEKLRFSSDENPELKGYNYISSKDIDVNTSMCNYDTGIIIPTSETKYKVAPSNSTLLCIEGGSAGRKITFTTEDVCFVNKLACFKSTETTHPKFVYYFLQSNEFKNQFQSSLSGLIGGVSLANLNDFEIPFPPIKYQSQIAAFLDQKTAQIDTIIEKKQKLLQLLDQKKKAVINEAVTKGLNPDVPMKDSGIEWLGIIPESWKVRKMKFFLEVKHGYQFREYDFKEEGIKVVKISQLKADGSLDITNSSFIDSSRSNEFTDIKLFQGDILMALTGGTIGKIIRVPNIGDELLLQNYRVGNFYSKDEGLILKDYLFWLLSSDSFLAQIFFLQRETGQPNIGKEDIDNMFHCIPSIKEQVEIVDYINFKVNEINSVTTKVTLQIIKLKEYRQSLISEAVTGKIDVSKYN